MKRIYISDIVHDQLKKEAKAEGRTLQWVVENKLVQNTPSPKNTDVSDFLKNPVPVTSSPFLEDARESINNAQIKNNSEATPSSDLVKDAAKDMADKTVVASNSFAEQECCQHPTRPCKHWVWDNSTGEGYKNTLSGRYREAE